MRRWRFIADVMAERRTQLRDFATQGTEFLGDINHAPFLLRNLRIQRGYDVVLECKAHFKFGESGLDFSKRVRHVRQCTGGGTKLRLCQGRKMQ